MTELRNLVLTENLQMPEIAFYRVRSPTASVQSAAINRPFKRAQLNPFIIFLDIPSAPQPLHFLVNPSDIAIAHRRQFTEAYTRQGWITEHWGEQLDTIAGNGTTAGFFLKECGMTMWYHTRTIAYRNFMKLYAFYRNNGVIYRKFTPKRPEALGAVIIWYDNTYYWGSFNDFRFTYNAEDPFKIPYTFNFTVRQSRSVGKRGVGYR